MVLSDYIENKGEQHRMKSSKNQLIEKVEDNIFKFKSYWKKPPKGYQVSYKEFATFALGCGGQSFLGILIQYTTLATSVHLMISYFKMSTSMAWLLGIFGAIASIIRSPILSMIIDNSNGKNGKFKPFLMWSTIGSIICFGLVPYIPKAWTEISLFSISLPAIPIMGVNEASTLDFSLAIVLAFILVYLGWFFDTLLNQCVAGIEQTISTVAQERANIGSLKGLVSNIPSSVVNIIIPILAGTVFAEKGGWNSVEMYRLVFPFCAVGSLLLVSVLVKGVHERTVVNQNYVAKVKFSEGVKILTKNKYFWIINIVTVFMGIRGLSNITAWITQYSFKSGTAVTIVGLYCSTLLMNAIAIALLLGPILVKKLGKRNLMILTTVCYTVMTAIQLIFYKHPVVILVVSFFQQLSGGFYFLLAIMTSDVLDQIQYKTGKRLEGFWQNYSVIVTTVIGIFTGLLTPLFLQMGGIGFSDDLSVALQNEELRNGAFFYQTLLALIGSIITVIPCFFYDLTEKKHANIVRALKIRAAVDNYNDNQLQDEDVLNLKEIVDYSQENNDEFINNELSKYNCIDNIIISFDEVKARVETSEQIEREEEFARNVELEAKKLDSKLAKAKAKAQKKGQSFSEDEFTKSFIENSRFLKDSKEFGTNK